MSDCLGSKKARPQNENAQQNQNGLQSQSERCALVQPRQILQMSCGIRTKFWKLLKTGISSDRVIIELDRQALL